MIYYYILLLLVDIEIADHNDDWCDIEADTAYVLWRLVYRESGLHGGFSRFFSHVYLKRLTEKE